MAAKGFKFSQESKDTDSTISVESNDINDSYKRYSLGIDLDNNEWIGIKLNDFKNQNSEYENQNFVKQIDYQHVKFDSSKEMISRIDRRESSCQTDITQDFSEINDLVNTHIVSNKYRKSLAVELKNVCFQSRKENFILRNVNMNVNESSIYCLMGSSGCGKSSLLKCIMGRLRVSPGTIKVFNKGEHISEQLIGFMPQELALYYDFTIKENLIYFASIYGMNITNIKSRIDFLINFLDLPEISKLVSCLSAGQKKKVSLAVAIVHNPPLLLLDEPTLGIDPLLQQSIWNQLIALTQTEKMTIIMTTQYAEETKRADLIGFIHENTILLELNPCDALKRFSASSLEEVSIKVNRFTNINEKSYEENNFNESAFYVNDENEILSISSIREMNSLKPHYENKFIANEKLYQNEYIEQKRIIALINKNILLLRRNIFYALILCLILPLIQVILFCAFIGNEAKEIEISVYNPETLNSSNTDSFSYRMLQKFESTRLRLFYYKTAKEAIDSVKSGDSWAAIVFTEYFTESLLERLTTETFYRIENDIIEKSTIKLFVDMTNFQIKNTLFKELSKIKQKFSFESLSRLPGANPNATNSLIETQTPTYGELNSNYRDFAAQGFICFLSFIIALSFTTISFINESKEKLLERNRIAGIKTYQIFFAHISVHMILVLFHVISSLLIAFCLYDIPNEGSIGLLIVITLLQGIIGMCFGFLMVAICDRELIAFTFMFGLLIPLLLMSGILWPLESVAKEFRILCYLSPQSLSVQAFRLISLRGWGFHYFEVWIGFCSSIVWISITSLLACLINGKTNQ